MNVSVTCPHRNKSYVANLPRGAWTCALCGAKLPHDDTTHKRTKP